MALEIILGSVFVGTLVTGLRVVAAYNRFEEIRRDSELD